MREKKTKKEGKSDEKNTKKIDEEKRERELACLNSRVFKPSCSCVELADESLGDANEHRVPRMASRDTPRLSDPLPAYASTSVTTTAPGQKRPPTVMQQSKHCRVARQESCGYAARRRNVAGQVTHIRV